MLASGFPAGQRSPVSQLAPSTPRPAHGSRCAASRAAGTPLPYLPLVAFPTQAISRLQFPPSGYCRAAPARTKPSTSPCRSPRGSATRVRNSSRAFVAPTGLEKTTSLVLVLLDPCPGYILGQKPLLTLALHHGCQRYHRYPAVGGSGEEGNSFPNCLEAATVGNARHLPRQSLQLPTFPRSRCKAGGKTDHPFQPTGKPAVPGTPWEAVTAEPFQHPLPAPRQEEFAFPSLGRSKIRRLAGQAGG